MNPTFKKTFTVADMVALLLTKDQKAPCGIYTNANGVVFPPKVVDEKIDAIGFETQRTVPGEGFNLHDPDNKNTKLNGKAIPIVLIHAPGDSVS